jgi:hypothetical protein
LTLDTHLAAGGLEQVGEIGIDDRIEDDSRRLVDRLQHGKQLTLRADQRIHMLDRVGKLELRGRGPTGGNESLSRRVRNQMEMKEVSAVLHVLLGRLLINRDKQR